MSKGISLSKFENEDAIDLLAEIIEPASLILSDEEFSKKWTSGQPVIFAVKYALKNHKKEVVQIISALHGENPETYRFNLLTLTADLILLLNDPYLKEVFISQAQNETNEDSGSVMVNTEEVEN